MWISLAFLRCFGKEYIPKIPEFTKLRYKKTGYVVDVYDGDTFTIICWIDNRLVSRKVRIVNIDAPEIKQPRNMIPELKNALKRDAVDSRDALSKLIINKIVRLHVRGTCKYGRLLGDVRIKKDWLSDLMVSNGHAVYKEY